MVELAMIMPLEGLCNFGRNTGIWVFRKAGKAEKLKMEF
jgi:hypothetical protein